MGTDKHARVDPELERQLGAVAADDSLIQAVVYLDTASQDPDEIERMARALIETVSDKTASRPRAVNVMRYLGTVALEAPAPFIRALIDEPEVASAIANVQPDDDLGRGLPNMPSSPSDTVDEDRSGDVDPDAEAED
jgi:hypothetical protein